MVLFDLKHLVPAIKTERAVDALIPEQLIDSVAKFDDAALERMAAGGCVAQSCTVGPYSVLYVPAGFLVCEKVTKGVLVYGARKSLFIRDASQASFIGFLFVVFDLANQQNPKLGMHQLRPASQPLSVLMRIKGKPFFIQPRDQNKPLSIPT